MTRDRFERMKTITVIQVGVKIFFTIAIFLFIKNENDFLLYAGINSGAIILMGVIALLIIIFRYKVQFRLPTLEMFTNRFKEGWNIYISAIAINIYSTSNTFILGLFAPDVVIGYYAAADKIRMAIIPRIIWPASTYHTYSG